MEPKVLDIQATLERPSCSGTFTKGDSYCAWGSIFKSFDGIRYITIPGLTVDGRNPCQGKITRHSLSKECMDIFIDLRCPDCAEQIKQLKAVKGTPSFIKIHPHEGCSNGIAVINDTGEHERARRLAIQLVLEKGYCVPAEKDLELSKELTKVRVAV